jgi:two-component system KDP operon response regulator KdpE
VECAIRLGWDSALIRHARTRAEALKGVAERKPDLVVIDDSFPDASPLALTRQLRSLTDAVIVITTREYDEYQLAAAVDAGADDYLERPVNPAIFVPRMRAATRRAARLADAPINLGGLQVDPSRHEVLIAGRDVRLTASEFKVLVELARLGGRVATRDTLAGAIWGDERSVYGPWLRKYIQSLRRRVCDAPGSDIDIVTVPRVGYRLVVNDRAIANA